LSRFNHVNDKTAKKPDITPGVDGSCPVSSFRVNSVRYIKDEGNSVSKAEKKYKGPRSLDGTMIVRRKGSFSYLARNSYQDKTPFEVRMNDIQPLDLEQGYAEEMSRAKSHVAFQGTKSSCVTRLDLTRKVSLTRRFQRSPSANEIKRIERLEQSTAKENSANPMTKTTSFFGNRVMSSTETKIFGVSMQGEKEQSHALESILPNKTSTISNFLEKTKKN
jgi:hypothetical protein